MNDDTPEETEVFTVELSAPSWATLADDTGVGTITDDMERRIGLVNQTVLPEIGRALAFSAVKCRIDQAFSDAAQGRAEEPVGRLSLSLAPTSDGWAAAGTEPLTLKQALGDSSFLMPSKEEEGGAGAFRGVGLRRLPQPGGRRRGRRGRLERRGVQRAPRDRCAAWFQRAGGAVRILVEGFVRLLRGRQRRRGRRARAAADGRPSLPGLVGVARPGRVGNGWSLLGEKSGSWTTSPGIPGRARRCWTLER